MVVLLNDSGIVPGVCAVRRAHQQVLQFDKSCEIHARHADRHPGADDGIEHPVGNGDDHAHRPHDGQKSARCPLGYAPDEDLTAKIGMPAVMNFQFLPDMGRMNG